MKRYVVGDIHGCYDELKELYDKIVQHADLDAFKIIFVGDYVDRGPDSKSVINFVMNLQNSGHVALMGNHEDMLIYGELMYAKETLKSFQANYLPESISNWMRTLPKYYEDDTIVVSHAGIHPGLTMDDQPDTYLLWYRYERSQPAGYIKHFYHGHTPTIDWIERAVDRTNVDTGCVFGGHLTAAVVGDDGSPIDFIQVKANKNHYH
jgi:serine/threonine protein phosphatase 1